MPRRALLIYWARPVHLVPWVGVNPIPARYGGLAVIHFAQPFGQLLAILVYRLSYHALQFNLTFKIFTGPENSFILNQWPGKGVDSLEESH